MAFKSDNTSHYDFSAIAIYSLANASRRNLTFSHLLQFSQNRKLKIVHSNKLQLAGKASFSELNFGRLEKLSKSNKNHPHEKRKNCRVSFVLCYVAVIALLPQGLCKVHHKRFLVTHRVDFRKTYAKHCQI